MRDCVAYYEERVRQAHRRQTAYKAVAENYLPHQIANYLDDLARAINDYYEKEPVLKSEEPLRGARLNLVNSAAGTLKTGLGLLGIRTSERM
ncbi:MAG: hypothetical protein HYW38_01065 [Candidatus Colwellbacteria bacterium]|nr:hypothetical protein [Candidatus Colwellbacteria bacterium]